VETAFLGSPLRGLGRLCGEGELFVLVEGLLVAAFGAEAGERFGAVVVCPGDVLGEGGDGEEDGEEG
jgi:hypothetical protein